MRTKRMLNILKSSIQKTIFWPFSLFVGKMKKKTQLEIVTTLSSESHTMNWTKQRDKRGCWKVNQNNCEFRVEGVDAGYENSNAWIKDRRSGRKWGSRRSKYSDPSLLKCLTSAIRFLKNWQITYAKDKRWNYRVNLCMFQSTLCLKYCKTPKPAGRTARLQSH